MLTLLSALGSLLSFRVRSRAALELELVALRLITCAPEALSPGYTSRRNVGAEGREPVKP